MNKLSADSPKHKYVHTRIIVIAHNVGSSAEIHPNVQQALVLEEQ